VSIRLHIVVEGQSEETFVNRILVPHLSRFAVWTDARSVYTSHQGPYWIRGGMTSYERARRDVTLWLRQDRSADVRLTTMFDFYRLPPDFPGVLETAIAPTAQARVDLIEKAFASDVNDTRFIPYLQVHEFEALIFTDVESLSIPYPGTERNAALKRLGAEGLKHKNPETIDLENPPSTRILKHIPDYDKVSAGVLAIEGIGLQRIRQACSHFNRWLTRLEGLSA